MPKPKVMVLAGGPDKERPVSLESAAHVTQALIDAGYDVRQREIAPDDLSPLDEWTQWSGPDNSRGDQASGGAVTGESVVFPVLHGPWGEGGPLQRILEERDIPYVGCTAKAAALCIDKHQTKLALIEHNLPTPRFELLATGQAMTLQPPVVIKALNEGSSFDVAICMDSTQAHAARQEFAQRHPTLLVEQYIAGKELAVGVIAPGSGKNGDNATDQALPPVHIVPATEFYDYHAKYHSNDTQYFVDPAEIDLPAQVLAHVQQLALNVHHALACRHMSRTDFIVDENHQPWILETNTIPGFTGHSLLPMAAAFAGLPMPALVDRLVRLATYE